MVALTRVMTDHTTRGPRAELLPDALKQAWRDVENGRLGLGAFQSQQERGLDAYARLWRDALMQDGATDLAGSLAAELGQFVGISDRQEVERRMRRGVDLVADEWRGGHVDAQDRSAVEQYYDKSTGYLYDLMRWHTLEDDLSPLGYVTALAFAERHGCRDHLDFGSGVGSGSLLFARHGFETTLADISGTMLAFARWRFEQRRVAATFIDLKTHPLPEIAYDLITAMDVFEHLHDPADTIDVLWRALRPGGYLFGRFHAEPDETHPQHIVFDFGPTFDRLRQRGFEEAWRDEWLWGHQLFRRA